MAATKKKKYIYSIGRRKSSIAKVRLYPGSGKYIVNDQDYKEYFNYFNYNKIVVEPFVLIGKDKDYDITVVVRGGGKRGQAEAIRLGISRSLVKENEDFKPTLKKQGLLKRDPRVKERKKYGLKKARRAPQWQKR